MKKLVISKNATTIIPFTEEEVSQLQAVQELAEQQTLLDSLIPTLEEVQKTEMELLVLELLLELEVI